MKTRKIFLLIIFTLFSKSTYSYYSKGQNCIKSFLSDIEKLYLASNLKFPQTDLISLLGVVEFIRTPGVSASDLRRVSVNEMNKVILPKAKVLGKAMDKLHKFYGVNYRSTDFLKKLNESNTNTNSYEAVKDIRLMNLLKGYIIIPYNIVGGLIEVLTNKELGFEDVTSLNHVNAEKVDNFFGDSSNEKIINDLNEIAKAIKLAVDSPEVRKASKAFKETLSFKERHSLKCPFEQLVDTFYNLTSISALNSFEEREPIDVFQDIVAAKIREKLTESSSNFTTDKIKAILKKLFQ